ncbi:MAG: diaminopimelate decarboxylase [Atribacterota bacterium]|nr:diaminopimelate decarboxylase [Atribacterota bacterium]
MNKQNTGTSQINREGFSLNKSGNLEFDRCELVKLAQKYETPCYIFSENVIRKKCREYVTAFSRRNINFEVIYAGKAFLVKALCSILKEEGLGLDVASGGELYTALSANFPPEKIHFNGNNKSKDEIEFALKKKIGILIVDNEYELEAIEQLAEKLNIKVKIMLRVTPGVDTHTHKNIQTGQVDSKFGISINKVPDFMKEVLSKKHLIYEGIHCHIGSQIFDLSSYVLALEEMVKLMKKIKSLWEIDSPNLDLGGGLGVKYLESDTPPSIEYFVNLIVDTLEKETRINVIPMPKILIEPGRSIIGEAGITIYAIGAIKEITGLKKYLIVDGGMTDNPRPILYNAKYEAVILDKIDTTSKEIVTIAGKCCESGDILIKDLKLPKASIGDLLLVFSTGAYHHSMASNYNGLAKPAVVLVNNGKSDLIVKRETYADLVKNNKMPEWFK